jgi:CRP/FNR family transcriptional regulator
VLLSTLDELDAARDWMVLLGCQTVLERVAAFLIIVRRRMMKMASDEWMPGPYISVPIGRRDMATYLGTTVESISRTIRAMARKGVIRIVDSQNFEIVHWSRLVALSGREEFGFDDGGGRGLHDMRTGSGAALLARRVIDAKT